MNLKIVALFLLLIAKPFYLFSQSNDSIFVMRIKGTVIDKENRKPLGTLMIVNKRTQQGFFSANGVFEVRVFSTDTLLIGSSGFKTINVCWKDSIKKDLAETTIILERLSFQAKEVEIFGARDLDKIQQDIEKLGYNKKDYVLSDIDALNSPITFLYQQFSRKERAKRELAELKNNDLKRSLLKELFVKYVASDLIDLDNSEFDAFVDYCNVSDDFMKTSSQYEFILFIKKKYEIYKIIKTQIK